MEQTRINHGSPHRLQKIFNAHGEMIAQSSYILWARDVALNTGCR